MKLFNTLTRQLEELKPNKAKTVTMYNCGPTVYFYMHIGNLRAYIFVDTLVRTLQYLGYEIDQVMNLTDVGHLTDDADEGQDKMEKTAQKEKKDIWEIAQFYIDSVESDFKDMNFLRPQRWVRATDEIDAMINMIKMMEKNGYTYETERALYFDVTKYHDYTRLQGGQELEDKKVGVRNEVNVDPDKKHPADFALWVKCVGPQEHHIMRWESPWGIGFPGWHIECSAMGTKYLGSDIDIHTGGEDHIPVHHTNERAQNYGGYEKEVVKMWVHNAFLQVDGGKMGKSLGNMYTLQDVKDKGFEPMDLRYFYLQAQYRTKQNFTWKNLKAAQLARKKLVESLAGLGEAKGKVLKDKVDEFKVSLENDLNTPQVLALIWDIIKDSKIKDGDKLATILEFDKVLGLKLAETLEDKEKTREGLKQMVEKLIEERDQARKEKNWEKADQIRKNLDEMGVELEDTDSGTTWTAV